MGLKRRGYFITFEGPEGSGKSTQIRRLASYLKKKGYHVLLFREPGGTQLSEAIRKILLSLDHKKMAPETELLLYLAARSQLVREKIGPAVTRGTVVICDRFEDSTLAYQGYGRGLSLKAIRALNRFARSSVQPHLTFLLDIPPQKGFQRIRRSDRIERESLAFHNKVRRGFLKLARLEPKRVTVLDARQDVRTLSRLIQEKVNRELR
jgi:dTMP kinase